VFQLPTAVLPLIQFVLHRMGVSLTGLTIGIDFLQIVALFGSFGFKVRWNLLYSRQQSTDFSYTLLARHHRGACVIVVDRDAVASSSGDHVQHQLCCGF
jgi:hypothetical protein